MDKKLKGEKFFMFKYALIIIWCILGILGLKFRSNNKVEIYGDAKIRKGLRITYSLIVFVLCFILFMYISVNGFEDIVTIMALVLSIVVMNIIFMSKDGVTNKGLLIMFRLIPWEDIVACSFKKENNKCVLYYTAKKGFGELRFGCHEEDEIRKLLKKKKITIKKEMELSLN